MLRKIVFCLSFGIMSLFCFGEEINQYELISLSHVKGYQSVGLRAGHGTKNRLDIGLTYAYCFNERFSLLVELDREWAVFGNSEFTNLFLISPGLEHNLMNPAKWFYWHWGIGAAVGKDRWDNMVISRRVEGWVFGAQLGTGVEFIPWKRFSLVLKGQQYVLFGNNDNYFKPNISLALRFNFHK